MSCWYSVTQTRIGIQKVIKQGLGQKVVTLFVHVYGESLFSVPVDVDVAITLIVKHIIFIGCDFRYYLFESLCSVIVF